MDFVFSRPLFMDPWTPTEIWKVAAKLHPQLSGSLVSWQQRVPAHSTVSSCPLACHAHVERCSRPRLSPSNVACRSKSVLMFLVAFPGRCFKIRANLTEWLLL